MTASQAQGLWILFVVVETIIQQFIDRETWQIIAECVIIIQRASFEKEIYISDDWHTCFWISDCLPALERGEMKKDYNANTTNGVESEDEEVWNV